MDSDDALKKFEQLSELEQSTPENQRRLEQLLVEKVSRLINQNGFGSDERMQIDEYRNKLISASDDLDLLMGGNKAFSERYQSKSSEPRPEQSTSPNFFKSFENIPRECQGMNEAESGVPNLRLRQ